MQVPTIVQSRITLGLFACALALAACSAADTPGSAAEEPPMSTTAETSTSSTAPATSETESAADSTTTPRQTSTSIQERPLAEVAPAAWTDCSAPFQCATVTVPLDHQLPDGSTIDLSLIRIEASGDAVGSIFVNLGGPGGSGVSSVRAGFRLDEETMESYHLVGFDPRGIGQSSPLSCSIDLADGPRPDFSPDDEQERAALDAQAKEFAEQCGRTDAELIAHIGTESVVSDLELLRRAVGDESLNYIGLSYGTVIGLRYAERHPDRGGRMVLDGVVNPTFTLTDLLRQQSTEFERAFETLDAACGTTLACPEGGIISSYDRLLATLEASGTDPGSTEAAGQVSTVGPAELQVAALVSMYSERLWPRLGSALEAAENGDLSQVEQLHDLYVGGASFAAYAAVSCIDSRSPVGPERWDDFAEELTALAPRFGAALANELRTSAYWPVSPTSEPRPVTAQGANPILVVSTTGDAATPLTNAVSVAGVLSSAGLVTVEDEGHTAYGTNFCVERIVADFFATGQVPAETHRC